MSELLNPELLNRNVSLEIAMAAAQAADDRKGADLVILEVSTVAYLADYFVIVSGFSPTQLRAIARAIEEQVAEKFQRSPRHVEGFSDARWILQDYGDVIVHIFLPQERSFYNLEAFWGHAEQVPWQPALVS